jgi:hypothetical protein
VTNLYISSFSKGKIATSVPQLLALGQFRPPTLEKASLVPKLLFSVRFRPHSAWLPTERATSPKHHVLTTPFLLCPCAGCLSFPSPPHAWSLKPPPPPAPPAGRLSRVLMTRTKTTICKRTTKGLVTLQREHKETNDLEELRYVALLVGYFFLDPIWICNFLKFDIRIHRVGLSQYGRF